MSSSGRGFLFLSLCGGVAFGPVMTISGFGSHRAGSGGRFLEKGERARKDLVTEDNIVFFFPTFSSRPYLSYWGVI